MSEIHIYTAKEIAKEFKVSVGFIRKLTKLGGIPYLKIGKAVRFDREQILEWIKSKQGFAK